jgi:hypothetical protein
MCYKPTLPQKTACTLKPARAIYKFQKEVSVPSLQPCDTTCPHEILKHLNLLRLHKSTVDMPPRVTGTDENVDSFSWNHPPFKGRFRLHNFALCKSSTQLVYVIIGCSRHTGSRHLDDELPTTFEIVVCYMYANQLNACHNKFIPNMF